MNDCRYFNGDICVIQQTQPFNCDRCLAYVVNEKNKKSWKEKK